MKQKLLILFLLVFSLCLQAQKDRDSVVRRYPTKTFTREIAPASINIYPVPVTENSFSVKTDRDITAIKVTNMIGQDIYRAQYKDPLSFTKVLLAKPARGMYLVTIAFVDGTRIVRKIMIENPQ
ncbi:MAG: T9SS type A sorting domain-containing protein [Bacteroidota bacterium]|nr:T9SS type A sorting domain-containing protein [Bacteroidota bacterium]